MGNFNFIEQDIKGVFIIEPKVFGDERGYFVETFHREDFRAAGIDREFVQHNESKSKKNVLRGLHFQKQYPQGKLVRAAQGEVYDVVVDLRGNSPTYGQWLGVTLSAENKRMLYVPEGFAHGFLVMSEYAVFSYLCTEVYHPEDEGGIPWNDTDIGVKWPLEDGISPVISDKDKAYLPIRTSQYKF